MQTTVNFTKDVKIEENIYKSYKYIPLFQDTDCNTLFGNDNFRNYTGVSVKVNETSFCVGSGYQFSPNIVLKRFRTYEVIFDSLYRDEISVIIDNSYLKCSNTCPERANDDDCDDGGPGSEHSYCELGTDCADCGHRYYQPPSPPPSPPPPLPPPPSPPPLPPPPSPPPSPSPPPGCQKGICIDSVDSTYPGFDNGCMYFISGSLINQVCPGIPDTMGKGNGQCLDGMQQLCACIDACTSPPSPPTLPLGAPPQLPPLPLYPHT